MLNLVWKSFTDLITKRFSYYNSATSQRTSLGLGSQNGFYTDQQTAPPKVSHR
tara:strand:- start:118 stop:276 length:159 start_codon:yes stop_codon:yes gene_type:complete